MADKLTFKKSTLINAPVSKVWHAITDPAEIKKYFFGTDVHTDWQKGSTISYTGEYKGKAYEEKGKIVDIIPEKLLHTTNLSTASGKEDIPENYANVIYELKSENGKTIFTISQNKIEIEDQQKHMDENWTTVTNSLKKLVESET
jgi:uncharacterized protein YndB with AHSA1/START domain